MPASIWKSADSQTASQRGKSPVCVGGGVGACACACVCVRARLHVVVCVCEWGWFTGSVKEFLTGMHIEPLVSLLLSLLNRNSGVDKQGRPGECGELSEWAQRFNMTATLSPLLVSGWRKCPTTVCLVAASWQIKHVTGRKYWTGFQTGEAALNHD